MELCRVYSCNESTAGRVLLTGSWEGVVAVSSVTSGLVYVWCMYCREGVTDRELGGGGSGEQCDQWTSVCMVYVLQGGCY